MLSSSDAIARSLRLRVFTHFAGMHSVFCPDFTENRSEWVLHEYLNPAGDSFLSLYPPHDTAASDVPMPLQVVPPSVS